MNQSTISTLTHLTDTKWITVPSIISTIHGPQYLWEGLDIKETSKGISIIAAKDFLPEDKIIYGGKLIHSNSFKKIDTSDCQRMAYIAVAGFNKKGIANKWLDAHPSNYPANMPKYAWIGSFINNPSKGETANAKLVLLSNTTDVPNYKHILKTPCVAVVIIKPIKKGQEILYNYGWTDDDMRALFIRNYDISRSHWRVNAKKSSNKRNNNHSFKTKTMYKLRKTKIINNNNIFTTAYINFVISHALSVVENYNMFMEDTILPNHICAHENTTF